MNARRLFSLILVLTLLATLTAVAAAAPLAGPCVPGAVYDSGCDANHDGQITIADIQLTAGHWNQTGPFVSDNNHTHLGQTWTGNNNLKIQGAFGAPDYAPLVLNNTIGVALRMAASDSAVYIDSAGYNGIWVAGAVNDGFSVESAGNHGVRVVSAGTHGVAVDSADGYGVLVGSAGYSGVVADTAQASGEWGFFTSDKIYGSNVLAQSFSVVAQVSGRDTLTPGDIVAVAGIADPVPGSTVHTPLVRLAGGSFINIVGVVESHLALTQQPSHTQTAEGETPTEVPISELRSVDGAAQPGDYVAITVMGAAQVKVDTAASIAAGQRLTVAANGRARPLGTIKVHLAGDAGTADLPESAPVIGTAMGPAQGGLVWVLVNPQ
jgi:hypothetical protein